MPEKQDQPNPKPKQPQPVKTERKEDGLEYRIIPEFPGYRINRSGDLQTAWVKIPGQRQFMIGETWKSRKIQHSTDGRALPQLMLNGRKTRTGLHCLILMAFIGPRPEPHYHACHNDGNFLNNHLSNLRWDTPSGNSQDRKRHGTENRGRTKLSDEQVAEIRASKASYSQIARSFGINRVYAGQVKRGKARPTKSLPRTKPTTQLAE